MRTHNVIVAVGLLTVVLSSTLLLGTDAAQAADDLARPDTGGEVGRWSSLELDANGKPVVPISSRYRRRRTATIRPSITGRLLRAAMHGT